MQTMFKWLILLLAIVRIEALGKLWKFKSPSANERTMKSILETCYNDETSASPIVVIGDYNPFDDKSPIIRLDHSFAVEEHEKSFKYFKASKIIIIGETSGELVGSLERLSKTQLWKGKAMIFMIDENRECKNIDEIIIANENMELLNLIYICSGLSDQSVLATMNSIANYAPHPWKRLENDEKNIFLQIFDPNVSCENLFFDKTKILNGHEIRLILRPAELNESSIGFFDKVRSSAKKDMNFKLILTIMENLNGSETLEFVKTLPHVLHSLENKKADIFLNPVNLNVTAWQNFVFLPTLVKGVAVVRLSPEVSTLEKIYHIWSAPVLHLAAISLLILFLVLTIMNDDFTSAALNLTRLLVYTSILRVNRRSSFRIYFTTMLILMVISNGVFQSQIAAFLTTTERSKTIETIDELVKLDYKMYTHVGMASAIERGCPKCQFQEVSIYECVEYVIKYPRHVCFTTERIYEQLFIIQDLDLVEERFISNKITWFHRKNWPLADGFTRIITRLTEAGIIQFWENEDVEIQKQKRMAMESEWHSAQYRPVKLYKLDFAFYLLAFGLGISIITFFLELLVVRAKASGWWNTCWRVLEKRKGVKGVK